MTSERHNGFTLLELLVAVAIIATLALLATYATRSARLRANEAASITNLRNLAAANLLYTTDHGTYVPANEPRNRIRWHGGRDSAVFRSDLWQTVGGCNRAMSTISSAVAGQTAQYRYNYPGTAIGNLYLEMWTLRNPISFYLPISGFTVVGLTRIDVFNILLQNGGVLGASGQQPTGPFAVPNSPAVVGATFDVQNLDLDLASNGIYWASNDVEATVAPFPAPVASFTRNPTQGLVPLTVQFTDTSINSPTAWQWDFQNDGVVDSTQQNPSWIYTTPGAFTARLVVSSQWGQSSAQQGITVNAPPPTAAFTATPTGGSVPLTVQFTDTSTFATSWQWDFQNDGVIDSTAQNPSFTYTAAGTYSVRLVATGPGGSNTLTQAGLITTGAPPSFTATPAAAATAPLTVQFAGSASFAVTQWAWDFQNDGVNDAFGPNPTFTYTANGIYSVRLTVTTPVAPFTRTLVRPGAVVVDPIVGTPVNAALNLALIAPGTYLRGSPVTPLGVAPYYNQPNAQPVHPVTISRPFWIGRFEVTQAQYQAVMGSNPSVFKGSSYPNAAQRPVETVTWHNAVAYCTALTASEQAAGRVPAGYVYRLPTEAEWEYCCRAGTTTEFHFGPTLVCAQANFNFSYHSNTVCSIGLTAVVGSYAPNAWGLHDMHGNVWEWCQDGWDGSANYPSGPVTDPVVASGSFRVLRGGSWYDGVSFTCRSAIRFGFIPSYSDVSIGFRVVLAPVLQ